jgi:hypothetical protein
MNAFVTRTLPASERRQVESARRASAGCRRASSDSRRGWGREHQFVTFPSTFTSGGFSSSTQRIALHYTARLWCAFTTQSMAVAYASSRQPKPKVRLLLAATQYVDIVFSVNWRSYQATVLRNTTHDFSNENGRPPFFITTLPC